LPLLRSVRGPVCRAGLRGPVRLWLGIGIRDAALGLCRDGRTGQRDHEN
jgi:hypothetical protein